MSDPKKVLLKNVKLQEFIDHCCHVRHYVFGIRQCGDNCSICKPPRLPPEVLASIHHFPDPLKDSNSEHYQPFKDLYGAMTTEQDRPSLQNPWTTFQSKCTNLQTVGMLVQQPPFYLVSINKQSYRERGG